MAFCSKCGTSLTDGARFCASCGAPVAVGVPAKPATENIRRCPACGAEAPAMAVVCASCGNEFRNVQVANSVQSFFEKLDAVDREIFEKEAAKEPVGGALGAMFGVNEMVNIFAGPSAGEKRKISLIESFPIPNSKEDIFEFLFMAASRIKPLPKMIGFGAKATQSEINSVKRMNEAWASKCQQAYNKAKIGLGTNQDAMTKLTAALNTIDAKKCGVRFSL